MAYKPLSAGQLRHVVEVQQQRNVRDAEGGFMTEWFTIYPKIYAAVQPMSAREIFIASAGQSSATYRFIVRFKEDIMATQRLLYRNEFYNIEGVIPDEDSGLEYLTLICSKGVNNG